MCFTILCSWLGYCAVGYRAVGYRAVFGSTVGYCAVGYRAVSQCQARYVSMCRVVQYIGDVLFRCRQAGLAKDQGTLAKKEIQVVSSFFAFVIRIDCYTHANCLQASMDCPWTYFQKRATASFMLLRMSRLWSSLYRLKLTSLDKWPEGTPVVSKPGHFVAVNVENVTNFPLSKGTLISRYEGIIKGMANRLTEIARIEALVCARDIFKNISILRGRTDNKAEVRFAYGNPIVMMLCSIHRYFLSVELRTPTEVTRCSSLASGDVVTERSTADYICYTLHHQDTRELKLAAVVMEMKTDNNYSHSSIAQLMGYYLRACKKEDRHTVAVLLTETKLHLLLFPFTKRDTSCVNAIWLNSIDFSDKNTLRMITVLFVLAVSGGINLEERFLPVTKDHTFIIQTEIELMKDELMHKLKEVEKERKVLAKEKRKIAAEKNEILKLL